jgi:hypothetical protein
MTKSWQAKRKLTSWPGSLCIAVPGSAKTVSVTRRIHLHHRGGDLSRSTTGAASSRMVHRVELREIEGMRDMYRHEMNCQIMFDSIHGRPGWSHEYLITDGEGKVGYGSVDVGGPWKEKPRVRVFHQGVDRDPSTGLQQSLHFRVGEFSRERCPQQKSP